MKISDFSIKRPVLTIVTMFLVILLGAVSLFKVPVTLIPELKPPIAVVVTSYPGASPEEVSDKLTKPLEESLSTTPGLKTMQSSSQEGSNFILLTFNWSTKIDDVQLDILQRLEQVTVPDGASKPRFMKFDPSQFPVIQLALSSNVEGVDVRLLAEQLETELRRTEGVANVTVAGKLIEEVQIILDQKKLEANGLVQSDIIQAIQANNLSMPGESIETTGGMQLTTRIVSTLTTISDIRGVIAGVNPLTGAQVTIADVADVALVEAESSMQTRADGQQAVLMSVLQESGSNTAAVSTSFKDALSKLLAKDEFADIQADILFDQGDYVKLAIGNIGQSLLLGGLFAMLVLFLFLRGMKSPIIIGIAIPYSVIVTFVLIYFADFTLNIMTLGALALGIGMLVDNAIVVIENIERHLAMGKPPRQAASEGTKEVGRAITASTLTTLAVFVPVVFISGLIGQIFTEFALTIAFSLFASLVVALTVVPMMASRLLKKPKRNIEARRRRSKALNRYERSVKWALQHRLAILVVTAVMLVISGFGLFKAGTEFLPATDEGFVSMTVTLPNGTSPAATDEVVQRIEARLQEEQEVDVYVSLVGGTQEGIMQGSTKANVAEIYVKLVPLAKRERSVFEFVDDVQPEMLKLIGEDAEIGFNMQTAAGSNPNAISFSLTDTDMARLHGAVGKLDRELKALDSVMEVTNDLQHTVEEIRIEVDREKAAALGLPPYPIAQAINGITRGTMATHIISENGKVFAVNVIYDKRYRNTVEKLKKLKLRTPTGAFVTLDEVAAVTIEEGPVAIRRIDQAHSVNFNVKYASSKSLGEMTKKVNETVNRLDLAEGTELAYSGDRELFEDAIDDMLMAVLLAVVLVYIVMAAQFESFKYPFVIMFSVPLMVIGVAIGLFGTSTPISVPAIIGILVLVGIVVNNGIVLVDYINQRKEAGLNSYEAILTASRERVRPIFMTALTTLLGLLPLALGIGEGTEINQPMGIAVIGGLLSSTLLTLYIVPVIYSLVEKETRKNVNGK